MRNAYGDKRYNGRPLSIARVKHSKVVRISSFFPNVHTYSYVLSYVVVCMHLQELQAASYKINYYWKELASIEEINMFDGEAG